jgi:hypothetical protein
MPYNLLVSSYIVILAQEVSVVSNDSTTDASTLADVGLVSLLFLIGFSPKVIGFFNKKIYFSSSYFSIEIFSIFYFKNFTYSSNTWFKLR